MVVLLSHNGFDVDAKLAARVEGIDIILTAHTHDALPQPVRVGNTLLVASGSHGKFLSRLDVEVDGGRVARRFLRADPGAGRCHRARSRHGRADRRASAPPTRPCWRTELARTEGLLYRRGTFAGTLDDVICDALLAERDAEIALSPGFRWGGTLIPGEAVTWEDVYNATAITYPAAYRMTMTGETIKAILEDVADNLFNPDPYYQQGGDMVRVGGMGYTINVDAAMGAASPICICWARARRSRPRQGLRRGRLGLGQPGHPGPADLGRRWRVSPAAPCGHRPTPRSDQVCASR